MCGPVDPGLGLTERWCCHCGEEVIDLVKNPSGWCDTCLEQWAQDTRELNYRLQLAMDPFTLEGMVTGDLPIEIPDPAQPEEQHHG